VPRFFILNLNRPVKWNQGDILVLDVFLNLLHGVDAAYKVILGVVVVDNL
jgi:hypothetical protein